MDFNLESGSPLVSRDIDMILQQIDILFSTINRELIGDANYGTQYDHYLYNLRISTTALEAEVMSNITSINLYDFRPDVKVYLMQGTEQDIALIEITLTRDDEIYKKIYKIS